MSVKIRLQRFGRKHKPYYHIVIANSRRSRNGKIIVRLGNYNPHKNPPYIALNIDSCIEWLNQGAQPTNRVKSLLYSRGVYFKKHLLNGFKKKALSIDQVEEKFNQWLFKHNISSIN